jgi:hypothetical protein
MKGASNWLTSLPIREENYVLNKREFYDAIRMRYRWPLELAPLKDILRSAILCVRGSRSLRKKQTFDAGNIEIASATTKLTTY